MNMKEKATAFLLGMAGTFIVIFLFFKKCGFGFGSRNCSRNLYTEVLCGFLCEKRKKTLLMQFQDMLEGLTSSYSSGKNTNGAFSDAYGDMVQIYGENADIVRELKNYIDGY